MAAAKKKTASAPRQRTQPASGRNPSGRKKASGARKPAPEQVEPQNNHRELTGVALIFIGILTGYCVLMPCESGLPHVISDVFGGLAGFFRYILPLFIIYIGGSCTFSGRDSKKSSSYYALLCMTALLFMGAVELFFINGITRGSSRETYLDFLTDAFQAKSGAGLLGGVTAWPLHSVLGLGIAGSMILYVAAIVLILVALRKISPEKIRESARARLDSAQQRHEQNAAARTARGCDGTDELVIPTVQPVRKKGTGKPIANVFEPNPQLDSIVQEAIDEDNKARQEQDTDDNPDELPTGTEDPLIDGRASTPFVGAFSGGTRKPVTRFAEPEEGTGSEEIPTDIPNFLKRHGMKPVQPDPIQEEPEETGPEDIPDITNLTEVTETTVPAEPDEPDEPEEEPADIPEEDPNDPDTDAPFVPQEPLPSFFDPQPHRKPVEKVHTVDTDSDSESGASGSAQNEEPEEEEYLYPPVDLLARAEPVQRSNMERIDAEKGRKLIGILNSFGIRAEMSGVSHGPTVTRYELVPASGVKVNSITRLVDDIALGLAAKSIRIEAPIPGKSAVGVEVPNDKAETVPLRDVLESPEAIAHPSRIAAAIGRDNSGRPVVCDLAKMPHVLIAGATGSGKSVCINCIICSILYRATPEEVRMIMIDPKMVELSVYNSIPHLLVPVVTDPKKAAGALQWTVKEMTDRYARFMEVGAKDIKTYNLKKPADVKPMPQIVVIIDELADLMMVAPGDVEDAICRIAQLARAAGIHLVIATQRPSVNVITGVIKANIPSRMAFTVASQVDSRTILDIGGAEKLLMHGDMLYAPSGSIKPQRVQGAWVSEDEVQNIVQYITDRHSTNYSEDLQEHLAKENLNDADKEEMDSQQDELLVQAIEAVVDAGQASISMLQRKMRIGYARAGRLIDEMSKRGIIGEADGAKPREVLISREQFRAQYKV